MRTNVIVIVVGILIIILMIAHLQRETKVECFQGSIPKRIWTYWDGDMPYFVQKCIESWKTKNPNYQVDVVSASNISRFLPGVDLQSTKRASDSSARFSDMVRLHILSKFGGVWVDASIVMFQSLDWISSNSYFVGYYLDAFTSLTQFPVIESWFFACPASSPLVEAWRDEFMRINDFPSVDDYVKDVVSLGVNLQRINKSMINYLAIHVAMQKVMQKWNGFDSMLPKMLLLRADDTALKYEVENDWNPSKAVPLLMDHKYNSEKLVKLRGGEREFIEKNYNKEQIDTFFSGI